MTTITIELNGLAEEKLRSLVQTEGRSEVEIIHAALQAYTPTPRRLPKGVGKYHSGTSDTSARTEEILRDAATPC